MYRPMPDLIDAAIIALAVLIAIAVCVLAALYGMSTHNPNPPAAPDPRRTTAVCRRCGSEFWSQDTGRDKPLEVLDGCPNCPLTDNEFENLKKQVLDNPKSTR